MQFFLFIYLWGNIRVGPLTCFRYNRLIVWRSCDGSQCKRYKSVGHENNEYFNIHTGSICFEHNLKSDDFITRMPCVEYLFALIRCSSDYFSGACFIEYVIAMQSIKAYKGNILRVIVALVQLLFEIIQFCHE